MTIPSLFPTSGAVLELDLPEEYQALYLAETDELLQRLEEILVALERAPDDAGLVQEIFRAAHTLKGSAATIQHTRMAALTHAMESRLDQVRQGTATVTPGLIDGLLGGLDALRILRDEVETRRPGVVDLDGVLAGLAERPEVDTTPAERALGQPRLTPSDEATHRLEVRFEPNPWASVRALQVLLAIEEQARLVASSPTQAEIERETAEPPVALEILLAAPNGAAEVRAALERIPELEAVRLEPLTTSNTPAPADSPPAPTLVPESTRSTGNGSKTVRIDVTRLDTLLNLVGELVIDRTRLHQLTAALADGSAAPEHVAAELQRTSAHIGRVTDELQEEVMQSRMLPVETVFNRLPRVARDLAAKLGKQVAFVVEGKDTELDRSVIEEIGDPLIHLIRNAVDHGLESPEERIRAGKPPEGLLRLTARHVENHILISLEDDGRGISLEQVKRKAIARGLITAEEATRLTDREAARLIFEPGLSTAAEVSDVSGRGVGMDVVRANVEKLNGSIDLATQPGQGTTVTVRLPLTLAILRALLVEAAATTYALPLHSVTETLRVTTRDVHRVLRGEALLIRGVVLPLLSLHGVLGLQPPTLDDERLVVVVRDEAGRQVGLVVERLVGDQEVVIKSLSRLVGDVPGVSGAAILGTGEVALILDVSSLLQRAAAGRLALDDDLTIGATDRAA